MKGWFREARAAGHLLRACTSPLKAASRTFMIWYPWTDMTSERRQRGAERTNSPLTPPSTVGTSESAGMASGCQSCAAETSISAPASTGTGVRSISTCRRRFLSLPGRSGRPSRGSHRRPPQERTPSGPELRGRRPAGRRGCWTPPVWTSVTAAG